MPQRNEPLEKLLAEATQCERRNLTQARALAQEALARCQAEDYPSGSVYALRLLAAIDLQEGRMDEGAALLEQGLALARQVGEPELISACLHTQGWLHYAQGALVEAITTYYEAVRLRLQPGAEAARANTYNNIGIVYRELGDYDQALHYHALARELRQSIHDISGEGQSLNNLGTLEGDRKSYTSALRYYQEALECAQKSGDLGLEIVAYYNIAHSHVLLDQPEKAVPFSRQARRCARVLGNPIQRTSVRLLDGMVYCALGRFPRAERSLLFALSQARELQDTHMQTRALNELGNLYLQWQRPAEAQRYLESCLELGAAMKADLQLAACHEYLVQAHEQQGNFERALFHHRAYYRIERERFDSSVERQRLALRMSLDIERTEREIALQQQRNAELEELARRDGMTGLYNHRAFQELLREHLATATPLALLFLDVDHFKSYNDAYGHPAGDTILQRLAHALQECLGDQALIARYGGEEFAILLTGEAARCAHERATLLGEAIRQTPFPHRRVTVSIGVAIAAPGTTADGLIAAADTALYQAKNSGRDRWARAA